MKKLFLMLAAATFAANVSAQGTAITSNKFGDNWYIGANVGAATPQTKWKNGTEDWGFMKGFAPKLGVRVGKNLTTVFGLAADADVYMLSKSSNKSGFGNKTFVNSFNLSLLGTFNLNNLFAGYQGEPRAFEVIALGGLGWGHAFGGANKGNALTSKAALDFAFNLGAAKALQIYIEPAIGYNLQKWGAGNIEDGAMQFDSRKGFFQLSAGVNYKFGNSNGTHNFAKAQLRDQAEIDGLNAKINELRADNNAKDGQLSAKDQQIADLKKKLADCEARPQTAAVVEKTENVLQPHVIFRQGKSTIDPAQYASIEMVAKYMKNHKDAKVKVQGYASPEGKAEFNQKLSEKRAEVVKNALVKRYKIAADRITIEGLGATDKLSSENDFNRVAMFVDTTK
jgi:outer membrane protein OmpA-like peptidoglycan-associated protein